MGAPKQKWTSEEEAALKAGIKKYGIGKWSTILKDPDFSKVLRSRSNVDLKVLSYSCLLIFCFAFHGNQCLRGDIYHFLCIYHYESNLTRHIYIYIYVFSLSVELITLLDRTNGEI